MGFPSTTKMQTQTVSDSSFPTGCSVQKVKRNGNDIITVTFNTLSPSKSSECSASSQMMGSAQSASGVSIELSLDTMVGINGDISFVHSPSGEYCSKNQQNVLSHFPAATNSESDQIAA